LVLRMLWHTHHINEALDIRDQVTSQAYQNLRTALIAAVRNIHVSYDAAQNFLMRIAESLKRFRTVVSLNYDLLLYWSILAGNTQWGQVWFKDCFLKGAFTDDWQALRVPYRTAQGATLLFYPHGNLALAIDLFGEERELLTADYENLISTIVSKWELGTYSPLFVSEGVSEQKLAAIRRSHYLNAVYNDALPDLGTNVAVFGWSMGDQDKHILQSLGRGNVGSLAVSVLSSPTGLTEKLLGLENKIRSTLGAVQVRFFDANSNGLWVND
jgi:hypothetical protein